MVWTIKATEAALKQLRKLDKPISRRILDFLEHRVARLNDPRSIGEALKGSEFGEYWKYRVGDYRIICDIKDKELNILVIRIGNRREVYRTP